jgi:hypothetical protein
MSVCVAKRSIIHRPVAELSPVGQTDPLGMLTGRPMEDATMPRGFIGRFLAGVLLLGVVTGRAKAAPPVASPAESTLLLIEAGP